MHGRPILPSLKPFLPAINVALSQDAATASGFDGAFLVSSYERDSNIKPWIAHKPLKWAMELPLWPKLDLNGKITVVQLQGSRSTPFLEKKC